jgi:hypothetical protein
MDPRRFARLLPLSLALTGIALACNGLGPTPTRTPTLLPAQASEPGVSLTVYNQGTALVRDRRRFDLSSGFNEVAFTDVASQMDPTSVLFRSLTDPQGTQVLEQNYEFDLVGVAALLQRYLDQHIRVLTQDGTAYEGTLLSAQGDIILEGSDGRVMVITQGNIQDFSFPDLPEGLITRPTLVWSLQANQAGTHDVEVTYLTNGISWTADYVLLLSDDEEHLDLDGWISLNNNSGASFENALLKLIAGDLQRLQMADMVAMEAEYGGAAQPTPGVEQREFFEYHLYEIPRPVTVRDREIKQIEFINAAGVPSDRFYVYDGLQCQNYTWYCAPSSYPQTDPTYGVVTNARVMVMVEFDTDEVGADLPGGRVRLYQEDVDGAALLIGEDTLDHTPQGETVRLYVGDAFDIIGERIQTDFRTPNSHSLEEEYSITLSNHKDEAVEVRVVEHLFRWSEWTIFTANADYREMDSSTIEFRVPVPANGEATIHYGVRYTWP